MILTSNGNVLHVRLITPLTPSLICLLKWSLVDKMSSLDFYIYFFFVGTSDDYMFAFWLVKVAFWSLKFLFSTHLKSSVILHFHLVWGDKTWKWMALTFKRKRDIFLSGTEIFFFHITNLFNNISWFMKFIVSIKNNSVMLELP